MEPAIGNVRKELVILRVMLFLRTFFSVIAAVAVVATSVGLPVLVHYCGGEPVKTQCPPDECCGDQAADNEEDACCADEVTVVDVAGDAEHRSAGHRIEPPAGHSVAIDPVHGIQTPHDGTLSARFGRALRVCSYARYSKRSAQAVLNIFRV